MGLVANFDIFTDNAQAQLRDRWTKFFNETADRLERCGGTEKSVAQLRDRAEAAQEDFLHTDFVLTKRIRPTTLDNYEVRTRISGPYLGYGFKTDSEGIEAVLSGTLSAGAWKNERPVAFLRLEMHDLGTVVMEEFAKVVAFFRELEASDKLKDPQKIAAKERQRELEQYLGRKCEPEFRRDAEAFWEKHRDAILSADMEGEALYSYKPTKTHERKVIRALAACDMLEVTERRGQPWFLKPTSQAYAVAKANGHLTVEETPDSKLLANFFRNVKKGQVAQKNC